MLVVIHFLLTNGIGIAFKVNPLLLVDGIHIVIVLNLSLLANGMSVAFIVNLCLLVKESTCFCSEPFPAGEWNQCCLCT